MKPYNEKNNFADALEESKDFGDIFAIVKRVVKKFLGISRTGLLLYLGDLPLNIGAYHMIGSNGIVLNRRTLTLISESSKSRIEVNAYIFTVLLHEYLHSLGYVDEEEVKDLVLDLTRQAFGDDHPVAELVSTDPLKRFPFLKIPPEGEPETLTLIKDFEKEEKGYIT